MNNFVFGPGYASAYDALYQDKDYDAECALIREAFSKVSPTPIQSLIDFGCGTGAHALRFAHSGVQVHGIDLSAEMLELADAKAKASGLRNNIHFTVGDIATTTVGGDFDAASMMFAVLCYQTTNERILQTLRNVRTHLRNGAPFIADVWYGPAVLSDRPGDRVREVQSGKTKILRTTNTHLDTTSHTADVHFGLWEMQGQKILTETSETHHMRYFFPQEIGLFLELTGFKLISLTAFPTLHTPVSDKSWNAVILAQAV